MQVRIFIFLMMALILLRCHDTETFIPDPDPGSFISSAFVEVVDVSGTPIHGVQIHVGNIQGYTNEDGVLYLQQVKMKSATYLVADKAGYFHGSRRFYPSAGKTQFVKIILLPEVLAGTIQSGTGGMIQVADGVQMDFPANAIVDKNGNSYEGTVSVFAQPILADDPDLSYKMPGDLVGISNEGTQGALASLGMMVAELRSTNGDLLQVKTGSKVVMKMEVPSEMEGSAPTTIPMWFFDEQEGLWKEEGSATLSGTTYTAEVGHFTYWNYDAWFEIVKWGATFIYENGNPASQVSVCITILELDATKCAYTNDEGLVCGMIASGELLLMEVLSPCGNIIFSQQIGPYSDETMIGPITIPSTSVSVTDISGVAEDCDGDPVTNGYARIFSGLQTYFAELDEVTGAFSISIINCEESDVTVTVLDEDALKQSLSYTFSYAAVIDAGVIEVCENITEYIDLEVVGFPDHFHFLFPNASTQGGWITISHQDSSVQLKYFYVRVDADAPGVYPVDGGEMAVTLPNGDIAHASGDDVTVTITYFGGSGDYVLGTLAGTWHTSSNGQSGPDYPLSGTFSVRLP